MSWFYNRDLKPQGPHKLEEIRMKILRGEIGPGDLVYNQEKDQWQMAIDWREFEQSLFPALQAVSLHSIAAEWVVLREVQEGPYSLQQIREMIHHQQITGSHYIWKTGLSGWVQIKDRPEFMSLWARAAEMESE